MDNAMKMYVATSVMKMIPLNSSHFNAALVKRFPKAFALTTTGILVLTAENLTDKDCKILIRTLENTGNHTPYGQFWMEDKFWNDLVRDKLDIGERATQALAKLLGIRPAMVIDIVPDPGYNDVMVLTRNNQHQTVSFKKLRRMLRKDHYRALVNGWGSYYGPLFNWL
jgi:hypothetical protein